MAPPTDRPPVLDYRTPQPPDRSARLTGWGVARGVFWTALAGLIVGGPLALFVAGGLLIAAGGATDGRLPPVQRAAVWLIGTAFAAACGFGLYGLAKDLGRAWREGMW